MYENVEKNDVLRASEVLNQRDYAIYPNQQYWVKMSDGQEYPYKELAREAVFQATGNRPGKEFQSNESNRYEFKRRFQLEIIDSSILPDTNNFVQELQQRYPRIWRCADSFKWDILKRSQLLSFDWLDPQIDYSSLDVSEIGRGVRSIKPWVHELRQGDIIFIMGKNNYCGVAIAKSEYNWFGPFLDMGDGSPKPAIEVRYIHRLEKPVQHNLNTHNNPTTFTKIDQYNFGLAETLEFLKNRFPGVYKLLALDFENQNQPISHSDFNFKGLTDSPKQIISYLKDKPSFIGHNTDWESEQKKSKAKGNLGERFVEFLVQANNDAFKLGSPIKKMEKQKDGIGYDYLVLAENNEKFFIEVKSTYGSSSTPFYMSRNERSFLKKNESNYRLVRVYNLSSKSKSGNIFILTGKELKSSEFKFKATDYEVSFNSHK
ncbi:MAG: DUF3883 domain-containing protein [Gracilimonas sp.]|uniref:DUF3883 domain-containing protein n=1 Tax=Gracilimonas sp. TaxID=1974203 RepID=UPI00375121AA|nr:DUF3883 domain-containing protein [Gracilimonas sp.]